MKRKSFLIAVLILLVTVLTGCRQDVPQRETGPSVTMQSETERLETTTPETEQPESGQSEAMQPETEQPETVTPIQEETAVREDGQYTSKEDVAAYLHLFGHLPENFITKEEARKLGWVSAEGNLSEVAPGKSIGGDYFGNFEGILPEKEGREYHECDIDSDGGYRGAKRIVYSNDGLIYYTEDHYETFELLYGEE